MDFTGRLKKGLCIFGGDHRDSGTIYRDDDQYAYVGTRRICLSAFVRLDSDRLLYVGARVVAQKVAVVNGALAIDKEQRTERQTVSKTVRREKEEVEVDHREGAPVSYRPGTPAATRRHGRLARWRRSGRCSRHVAESNRQSGVRRDRRHGGQKMAVRKILSGR
jgi:hypothetical protein